MHTAISSDKIDISSENNTEDLAKKFLQKIKPGHIIFLYGEIGVGKTTFLRYLINELQKKNKLKKTEVTSPTFNLLNEYQIDKIKIKHFDLFRIKSSEELENLDLFADSLKSFIFIEWPQIIKKKPKNLIELIFNYENDHKERSAQIIGLDL